MKEKVKVFCGKAGNIVFCIWLVYLIVGSFAFPLVLEIQNNITSERFKQIEYTDSIITNILVKQYDRMLINDNRYIDIQFKLDSLEKRIIELDEDLTDIFD